MVRTRRAAAVLVPALLVTLLAGCGEDGEGTSGSGLTADEQTVADNLATQIVRSGSVSGQDAGENAVTGEQASCIGEGAVGDIGLEALQGYGIITEELRVDKGIQGVQMSAGDADAFAGVLMRCIDAEGLFEERFLQMLTKGTASQQLQECVQEAVTAEPVRTILSASFQGVSTQVYGQLQKKVNACGDDGASGK